MKEQKATYHELFSNLVYVRLLIGGTISYCGDALLQVALPVYVYVLTGNPAALGGAFAFQQLPWVVVGPFAGVFADRFNRKKLLLTVILLEALAVALISLTVDLWQIYFLLLIASIAQVLRNPVWGAAMPDVIGQHLYSRSLAVGAMSIQLTDTVGVALGGD